MLINRLCLMVFFSFLIAIAAIFTPVVSAETSKVENPYEELQLLSDVMAIIRRNYVDEVPMKKLVEGAVQGVLSTLDPHSSFLSPDDYQDIKSDMSGQFVGMGIDVSIENNELVVIAPVEGSPAEKSGIISGDRILKIDGRATTEIEDVMSALRLLRGEKGSKVSLTIMRNEFTAPKDFILTRDLVKVNSVRARTLEPGFGYLRISQFQETTAAEVEKSLRLLHEENPDALHGLILDLRNNSGGLLDQAVNVANLFLESGLIVYTEGRDQVSRVQFSAQQRGTEPNYPLVLMINGGSASASEVVAGALKDQGRALLLGTQTFGKGTVQTIIPLRNDSGLRLTTARYFTPHGISIQAQGIAPDIIVYAQSGTFHGSTGKGFSEKDLPHHIAALSKMDENAKSKESEGHMETSVDNQLQYALDILKAGYHFQTQAGKRGQG